MGTLISSLKILHQQKWTVAAFGLLYFIIRTNWSITTLQFQHFSPCRLPLRPFQAGDNLCLRYQTFRWEVLAFCYTASQQISRLFGFRWKNLCKEFNWNQIQVILNWTAGRLTKNSLFYLSESYFDLIWPLISSLWLAWMSCYLLEKSYNSRQAEQRHQIYHREENFKAVGMFYIERPFLMFVFAQI